MPRKSREQGGKKREENVRFEDSEIHLEISLFDSNLTYLLGQECKKTTKESNLRNFADVFDPVSDELFVPRPMNLCLFLSYDLSRKMAFYYPAE